MGVGRALIVGGGAREHAIAWACHRNHPDLQLICVPGNGGTAEIADNVSAAQDQVADTVAQILAQKVDLVIVGPDAALAAGVADQCRALGSAVFGPAREAAKIEWSKTFAKKLMAELGIPTARWCSATARESREAVALIAELGGNCVVKADGLALGKGVVVCDSVAAATVALDACLLERKFGDASDRVVVEERLTGPEVSVFAFTDGVHVRTLGTACDYKRAFDGETGPNTGGMGAYTPASLSSPVLNGIVETILRPTLDWLSERGTPYVGCIYLGLMMTSRGPMVLEFNSRLGDPEAEVLLPLLNEDPLELFWQTACGELTDGEVERTANSAVGVVLASHEYPQSSPNDVIVKTTPPSRGDVLVFHGSTRLTEDGTLISKGGRVATVVGLAGTVDAARELAYAHTDLVQFLGKRFRSDIAKTEVGVA